MQGAEVILRTAAAAGVDVCFVNPGTTELPLVVALEKVAEIRPILGLFEGVLAGAADGYARIAGRPALVVVHQGPSLGNAVANLHNARRARSPVVALVGEQPSWHRAADAPLATDVEGLARVVASFTRVSSAALDVGEDTADAIAAALGPPGQVATLILPADCQWGASQLPVTPRPPRRLPAVDDARVREAAIALRAGRASLILGGDALSADALVAAARIASATGAKLFAETFPARLASGRELPSLTRLPYGGELAAATFADVSTAVLAGAATPVAFFGHEGGASRLLPAATRVVSLASPLEDVAAALAALADELGAAPFVASAIAPPPRPSGRLAPRTLVAALAHLLPEDAIVVDEGVSIAGALLAVAAGRASTRLPRAHRRRVRSGSRVRGRRRDRRARSHRRRPRRRRQRPVRPASALDPGA